MSDLRLNLLKGKLETKKKKKKVARAFQAQEIYI